MTIAELVRKREFKEVSQVKLDGKKRVILSAAGESGKLYKVYQNEAGQFF